MTICAHCGKRLRGAINVVSNPHGTLESMRQGESLCQACFTVATDDVCRRWNNWADSRTQEETT